MKTKHALNDLEWREFCVKHCLLDVDEWILNEFRIMFELGRNYQNEQVPTP